MNKVKKTADSSSRKKRAYDTDFIMIAKKTQTKKKIIRDEIKIQNEAEIKHIRINIINKFYCQNQMLSYTQMYNTELQTNIVIRQTECCANIY